MGYFEFLIYNLVGRAALLRGLGRPAGRPYQPKQPTPFFRRDHPCPANSIDRPARLEYESVA